MSGSEQCPEIREQLAELALGIADGEQRGRVLEHVAVCAGCRSELEALSATADEILVLAPEREPPAGFELRVLHALEPPRPQERRPVRRPLALAAVGLAAAALTAGVMLQAFRDDRSLASHYRSVLAEAHGSYFGAMRLRDPDGGEGGVVFLYRGLPSWIVITVDGPYSETVRRAEIVTDGGRRVPLPWFGLDRGTWGGALPVDVDAIAGVRLVGARGKPLLEAESPRRG